ncbi:hypothetical protein ETB97_007101 [Aspergillus alliaceus]|uniref:Uncharacterized protein n=1 Tax=Petromyces alliaceus TaxID=209559 RepID=A0A8H5ZUJ8_PETAA|nr:hypothetical protein ETB97_007101 [Aspergillus burnettii]
MNPPADGINKSINHGTNNAESTEGGPIPTQRPGGRITLGGGPSLDGSLSHLLTALHGSNLPYILPGTKSPLRTRIAGIAWPIDYLLDMLLVFFWEAVDGSHPATSAIGIYFLAQYLSVLTGIYVDSTRRSQSVGRVDDALAPAVPNAGYRVYRSVLGSLVPRQQPSGHL